MLGLNILFLKNVFIFIFGSSGSVLFCMGFLQLRRAGATLHCSTRVSHYSGFSYCGAQLQVWGLWYLWLMGSKGWVQQLQHTDLVAPWHVGSSCTSDRIHVPCAVRKSLIQSYHQGSPKNILLKLLISCLFLFIF